MAKGKVIQSGDACTVLVEGNKHKRLEPSEHIIEFPGGSIGVTRTSDDTYWAHITVNHGQVLEESHSNSKAGEFFDSRVDRSHEIGEIDKISEANHIGIRIRTLKESE